MPYLCYFLFLYIFVLSYTFILNEKFSPCYKAFIAVFIVDTKPSRLTEALSILNWHDAILIEKDALAQIRPGLSLHFLPRKKLWGANGFTELGGNTMGALSAIKCRLVILRIHKWRVLTTPRLLFL